MNQGVDSYAAPPPGFQTPSQPSSSSTTYSDGFRPGDIKYSYGVLADLLAQNPGWALADGTVVLQSGLTPPDLRDRTLIGAGASFALGTTGGSFAGHTHPFTHESAHTITQPVFAGPAGHSDHTHSQNHSGTAVTAHGDHTHTVHSGTAVAAHSNHTGTAAEFTATPGSGVWINTYNSAANAAAGLAHSAHSVTQPGGHDDHVHSQNHTVTQPSAHGDHTHDHNHDAPSRTTDVALSNNAPHAGGAVGSASDPMPYAALYCLIKLF